MRTYAYPLQKDRKVRPTSQRAHDDVLSSQMTRLCRLYRLQKLGINDTVLKRKRPVVILGIPECLANSRGVRNVERTLPDQVRE